MKIYSIFFSPTGGTEKAATILADALGEALGGEVEKLDLSLRDFPETTVESGSLAVIAVPSFGGRVPAVAIERLRKVHSDGAYAAAAVVYGNRAAEDALPEVFDTAKECGFKVISALTAVAEHSMARDIAAGRPDSDDEKVLREFAEKIAAKVQSEDTSEPTIPGNRPYKKAGGGMAPAASKACVKCGLCAKKCPVGAIDPAAPDKTDKNICIGCMRCVSVCPKGARALNAVARGAVGMMLKTVCSGKKENELFI